MERSVPADRRVALMATCLCDAFYDDVARATVQVLEHLGCEVSFPPDQTCCGQPAYTAGDWEASRRVVRHCLRVFEGDRPVVTPAGSCASMFRHAALLAFEDRDELPAVESLARRTWELAEFVVDGLGVDRWPGRIEARAVLHRSCHSRGLGTLDAARTLLESIEGLELIEVGDPEQCCGFGGVFSVAFPNVSTSLGRLRVQELLDPWPDLVISPDMSCLLHQQGLAAHQGIEFPGRHVAQLLRDALASAGDLP